MLFGVDESESEPEDAVMRKFSKDNLLKAKDMGTFHDTDEDEDEDMQQDEGGNNVQGELETASEEENDELDSDDDDDNVSGRLILCFFFKSFTFFSDDY